MAEKLLYSVSGGKVKGTTTVGYDTSTNQLVVGSTAGVLTTASDGKVSTSAQLSPSLGGTGTSNAATSGNILVGNGSAFASVAVSGDATITNAGAVTVTKIQGKTVSTATPSDGQALVWNGAGSQWVPGTVSGGGSGGGAGGGLVYYLNYADAASSPTPAGTWKQLSTTFDTGGVQTNTVSVPHSGSPDTGVAFFLTEPSDPGIMTIPPGLWDVNIFALTNTGAFSSMALKAAVHTWDGTTLSSALGESAYVPFTSDNTTLQYTLSVEIPQIDVASNNVRLVVIVYARNTNNQDHDVTVSFNGSYPTHVHTNITTVGGTGVLKVINGVMQSPASPIVDADVSSVGASKITGTLGVANGGTGLTSTGSSGNILISSGSAFASQTVGGDATLAANGTVTLKNTGTAGTYGNGTSQTLSITTDAQGRVTSATAATLQADLSSATGTLAVDKGGTGATSISTGRLVQGNGTTAFTAFGGSAAGQIPIWNNSTSAWTAATITGTTNQVNVSSADGTITLSLPQSIHTGASPTFAGLTVSALSVAGFVKNNSSGVLSTSTAVALGSEVSGTLPVGNGGTGKTTVTSGALLLGNGASALSELTGTSGQYVVHNGTTWAAAAAPTPTIPYDLSSEFAGKPSASQVIMNFVAATAFTLSTTDSDHKFKCVTAGSSGATVITITKVGSGVFATITYALGSTTGTVVITNSAYASIAAGDLITATVTSVDAAFDTPYFTLKGTA